MYHLNITTRQEENTLLIALGTFSQAIIDTKIQLLA